MGKEKKRAVVPSLFAILTLFLLLLLNCTTSSEVVEVASCSSSSSKKNNNKNIRKRVEDVEWVFDEEVEEKEDEETWKRRRALWSPATIITAGKRYISYEALKGDIVPCNRPGVPYYNCRALPKANPYTKSCSVITSCRGG